MTLKGSASTVERLKSKLVIGQMGQNCKDFGHVLNPNEYICHKSEQFSLDFGQLGLKP